MDDSTAVSQARSRLLNLVTNNRDFTPGPLSSGAPLAPVTSPVERERRRREEKEMACVLAVQWCRERYGRA